MTPRIMDRSIAAIRERSQESVLWTEDEPITGRISDQLWAARQDVVTLLAEIDAAARREAALREAIRVYLACQYPRGTGHPADWLAAELERALLSEVPQ